MNLVAQSCVSCVYKGFDLLSLQINIKVLKRLLSVVKLRVNIVIDYYLILCLQKSLNINGDGGINRSFMATWRAPGEILLLRYK